MSAPYTLSCLFTGNIFDGFNCLVVNSNFVLLYVLLTVLFGVVLAVYSSSRDYNIKNGLLLSSTICAIVGIFLTMAAAGSGYASTVILGYSSAAGVYGVLAIAALLFHVLGDL